MGYQPRMRLSRNSAQRREMPHRHLSRREKDKVGRKHRSSGSHISVERQVSTSDEVVNKTLNRLYILGNQRFALLPFNYHFKCWLMSLRNVLSEFESSPAIRVDDQFVEECSRVLSDIELKLEESRLKEISGDRVLRNLSDVKRLLELTEEEYAVKSKEFVNRRNHEVENQSNKVEVIRKELADIARMKTGFFAGVSKKVKAQRQLETTGRLMSAENELVETTKSFIVEQEGLRDEYAIRKQLILEKIREHEKEVDRLEAESQADASIEARRSACEALVTAVNDLIRRSAAVVGN